MVKQNDVTLSKLRFGEDTLDADIQYWQQLGADAIWCAIAELTMLGYALHGTPVSDRKIDRSMFVKLPAPWLSPLTEADEHETGKNL